MPTPDQIRLAMEQMSPSGHPAYTVDQLGDQLTNDSDIGQKVQKAMRLGVSKKQALNFYAYGTANGKPPEKKPLGFFEKIAQDVQGRRVQFGQDIERYQQGDQTLAETGFQFLGRSAQAAGDIVGGLLSPVIQNAPEAISTGLSAISPIVGQVAKTQMDAAGKLAGQAMHSEPAQAALKYYQGLSPRTKANVESAAAIGLAALDVVPGAKAVPKVLKETGDAVIAGGKKALGSMITKKTTEELLGEVDNVVGAIIQGNKESLRQARNALQIVDTTGVKTYSDLNKTLETKISTLATKQNEILDAVQGVHNIDEFLVTSKAGNQVAKSNPVANALAHLEEQYLKAGNMDDYVRIRAMKDAAAAEGLTARQINDLAREYRAEMPKAFNPRTGEALTSVSAELSENTRMGVKNAARSLLPDDASKLLDSQMSDLFDTIRNTSRMEEKVLQLAQKITERGLVERIGRKLGRGLDIATMGGLRGFLTSFFPSNVGLKVMNSLQIQANLARNLSRLEDLIKNLNKMNPDKAADDIIDFMNTMRKTSGIGENRMVNLTGPDPSTPGLGSLADDMDDVPLSQIDSGEAARVQSLTPEQLRNELNSKVMTDSAPSAAIPKELEPLAAEARKYKSAEEFRKAVNQSHLMDLSNPEMHNWGRAFTSYADEPLTDISDIIRDANRPGSYLSTMKYSNPSEYKAITSPGDTITIYRAVPRDVGGKIRIGDYVALDKAYAQMHLDSVLHGEQGVKGKIISKTVPKKDIVWGEADFTEWAYSPQELRNKFPTLDDFYRLSTGNAN